MLEIVDGLLFEIFHAYDLVLMSDSKENLQAEKLSSDYCYILWKVSPSCFRCTKIGNRMDSKNSVA